MKNRTLLAVVGSEIDYSLSPLIHSEFIKQQNLLAYYVPLSLNKNDFNKETILNLFNTYNYIGLNITYPYKEDILNFIENKHESMDGLSCANTVYFEDNKLKLANFDGLGCYYSFKNYLSLDLKSSNILLIGFGSTTKSILKTFVEKGVKNITIINRTRDKVEKYLEKYKIECDVLDFKILKSKIKNFNIVINTTSLSMYNLVDFLEENTDIVYYDVNYSKQNLEKMLKLRHTGVNITDGIPMLCYQASLAFEKWFKVLPTVDKNFIEGVYKNANSWFNRSYCKW